MFDWNPFFSVNYIDFHSWCAVIWFLWTQGNFAFGNVMKLQRNFGLLP